MIQQAIRAFQSGHWPTLVGAWLHFEVSFMVWLLIGVLSIPISEDFGLTATQKGFLVGVPLLGGAILRIFVGPLADQFGAKRLGLGILGLEGLALFSVWQWGVSLEAMFGIGILLGFAGASFAIALPLASQAYPPNFQGLAMGVAAVGTSGVLITSLVAPRLAQYMDWNQVFGVMLLPVILTFFIFLLTVQSDAKTTSLTLASIHNRSYFYFINSLKDPFMYWLCFLYAVTFGGFVGFSSYLPIFLHDQYQVGMVMAGALTAICAFAGSLARPIGGYMADRCGGLSLLKSLFTAIALLCFLLSVFFQVAGLGWVMVAIVLMMGGLGFGNGVIFQVVSSRFSRLMGTASGLIGAAGGIGGFFLPVWFGWLKDVSGGFSSGFLIFGIILGMAGISAMIVFRTIGTALPKPVEEF
ncbi:MAG: MFS transporter [Nitrospirales bacterium]|nr:MFS transporter [Nitrospirales bacterium]